MVQTLVVPDPLTDLARLEGVPSGLAAARDAVDVVLTDRGLRALTGDQVAAALLTGARASARLTDDPERWAAGAIRLSTEVTSRLGQLSELLTSRLESPALVLAAIAHAEIATVAPFGSADGLVARAVERMVLISAGFDPRGVIVTEVGHLRRRTSYENLLRGYASGTVAGVRDWILHVAQAAVDGAEGSPVARPVSTGG